jgi:hypothetical protein
VHVSPKRLPFFKVGKDLRLRVNGQRAAPPPVRRAEAGASKPAAPSPVAGPKPSVVPDPGMTEDVI